MTYSSKGAIDLLEEAVHLLRRARIEALAAYYAGTVPFVLALLFYWADMSRGAFAKDRAATGALLLATLFIWMKYWQGRFCVTLRQQITSSQDRPTAAEQPESLMARFRQVLTQTIIHTTGMIGIPVAILLSLPFGWVYAYYQNATVLADSQSLIELSRESWKQAMLWPKQNHVILWLISPILLCIGAAIWLVAFPLLVSDGADLSVAIAYAIGFALGISILLLNPFGVIVGANIGLALVLIPELLRMFSGVESSFTRSGLHMLNSTLFAVICGLTYLCLDPLVKTVYTLRCFYGQALTSGADLLVEFRQLRRTNLAPLIVTLLVLQTVMSPHSAAAADNQLQQTDNSTPEAVELDRSIRDVLADPEFAWRIPKDAELESEEPQGLIASFLYRVRQTLEGWANSIARLVKKFFNWLRDFFSRRAQKPGETNWTWLGSIESLLWLLAIVLILMIGILIWRLRRRPKQELLPIQEAAPVVPDLSRDNVSASQLPEDSWLALARELMSKGEFRLALRAFYLASLAHLADRGLVTIATFKSNREYERELIRRAHSLPTLRELFSANVATFDRVWYGDYAVDETLLNGFAANVERINAC